MSTIINPSSPSGVRRTDDPVAHPLTLPTTGRAFVGGFESTHLPLYGVDGCDANAHHTTWREDFSHLRRAGVRSARYPLRWPRIEPEPGRFEWSDTDRALDHLAELGIAPIVDLLHHTSYPDWLTRGFADRRFPDAFRRYAETAAQRYPWLPGYTIFNEPFATLLLAGRL